MDLPTAIRNTIFDTVLAAYAHQSDDQSLSPFQGEEILVGRVWPGQIIDEKQYGNAWSPTNPSGFPAATENLSILVDPIPVINEWYNKSGRKVEEMYEFFINGAEIDLPSNEGSNLLADTLNFVVDKGSKLESLKPIMNIISNKVIPEFKDIEVVNALYANNSKIQTLGMSQEALKKKAKEIAHSNASAALLAYKFAHEKVQGVKQQAALRSDLIDNPVELVQAARKTWEDIQETEVSARSLETRSSVHDAPISTDQAFYNARLIFARSKLASVQNPGISYHPTYTSPENWVDPSAKSGWPLLTIPVANTDTEVNLSITFSRVDITRPWLLASLFELKGWKNAQGPGSLSKGKLKDNDGSFSLLPQSMIVARDIVARTSTGDIVFRALGLQVLAYISKLVPFSPPSS